MKGGILLPGNDIHMSMTLVALRKTSEYILSHPMKPGETFTIEATDKKKLIIHIK